MKAILNPKDSGVEDASNGWSRPWVVYEVVAFRTGWVGAWDAIKAAWRKDTRLQLPTDLTTSIYIKNKSGDPQYVWGCRVETNQQLENHVEIPADTVG